MTKKVLVIFPNEWLAYSPSTLNLIQELSGDFDFTVLFIDDGSYKSSSMIGKEFDAIRIHPFILTLHAFFSGVLRISRFYSLVKLVAIFARARSYVNRVDEVIAIDSAGLWVAQKLFGRCHFMSLELFRDKLFSQCDPALIDSVIIQSQPRYDYLFQGLDLKTFFIQNAPKYQPDLIGKSYQEPKRAIFLGNANPRNGIYFCIEAIQDIDNIALTIKGTISEEDRQHLETKYHHLLNSGKVTIDNRYFSQDEILDYLSQFYVGFCFYDLSCTDEVTRFNFISVPSGKLFNYYAAGVPVIGSDLPGLASVKEFKAGVLLENSSADTVSQALNYIDANHEELRGNCFKAAAHFDFSTAVKPFREYLLSK